MAQAGTGKTRPPHILTLVIATATSALSMNVFLPSLPGMARYFDTPYATVQLAISLYLVTIAIFQLLIGPASDRFGRRPVMLFCFGVFNLGTFGAIFAGTIEVLLFFRLLQAFSAAGIVLSRAVVRDTVETDAAASRISYITMGMALVPMVAPTIGGMLDELYGWQASFVFALVFGLISFTVVFFDLRETNHARTSSFKAQLASYPELLRSRRFWGYTATATLSSGAFFAFIGGGPYIATELLGMSPSRYGLYFGIVSIGYVIGNFLSGRFSSRVGINHMMLWGNYVSILGGLFSIGLFMAGFYHPLSLFVPAGLASIGNGLTLPNAVTGMISVKPHLAGSASGLGGALQIGCGAIMSIAASAFLTIQSGPYPMLLVMLLSAMGAALATLYVLRVARQARPLP